MKTKNAGLQSLGAASYQTEHLESQPEAAQTQFNSPRAIALGYAAALLPLTRELRELGRRLAAYELSGGNQ